MLDAQYDGVSKVPVCCCRCCCCSTDAPLKFTSLSAHRRFRHCCCCCRCSFALLPSSSSHRIKVHGAEQMKAVCLNAPVRTHTAPSIVASFSAPAAPFSDVVMNACTCTYVAPHIHSAFVASPSSSPSSSTACSRYGSHSKPISVGVVAV